MALNAFRFLPYLFRLTKDALFSRNIPFKYRWRMLALQPLILITYSMKTIPSLFSPSSSKTIFIPTRSGNVRALLYLPKTRKAPSQDSNKLSPLHLDFHSGSFISGYPENHTQFHEQIVARTGAVVVACHYRTAPVHIFPAAIDDVDDVVAFLQANAEKLWGADPNLMTVSGFSAGANLALALCQQDACHTPAFTSIKASVTFYAPVDLRIPPWVKPKSENFPKRDPMAWLLPLYDTYAGPVRAQEMNNPRLSPIISDVGKLPERMLLIVASIDILVHEQLTFVERVTRELEENGETGRECVAKVIEGGFHGWLELPIDIPQARKQDAWDMAIEFLTATHRKYGWNWSNSE